MITKVALVIALALVTEQVASLRIMHIKLDDENLIKVRQAKDELLVAYAISSPFLADRNLTSITVKGDTLIEFGPDCQEQIKSLALIDHEEHRSRTDILKKLNNASDSWNSLEPGRKYMQAIYSALGREAKMTVGMTSSSHQVGQYEVDVYGKEYTVVSTKDHMPFDWLRYFVFGDMVAFVNRGASLYMMPKKCLHAEQLAFVDGVEDELNKTKVFDQAA